MKNKTTQREVETMKKEQVFEILERLYQERKDELENVHFRSKTRAFVVAGIDLLYNYMLEVKSEINTSTLSTTMREENVEE